jgi:pimeloyl-ACP methyl ester carboxylesterase
MTRLLLRDELLDAQLLRTVGSEPYGGAEVTECLVTAAGIAGTDLKSWYDAWASTADDLVLMGEALLVVGRVEAARSAFFRASSYFRTAGVMLMAAPASARLVAAHTMQTDLFRRGAALLSTPPELVAIPYDRSPLPGYFFRVDANPRRRATVVLVGGYDSTAEELYFLNGAAALARGYNVLAFDGPGQGAALLRQGLVLRPDFENVITPVLDYLLTRRDVDPRRVAVIGLSLGAYLAPRAAAAEHRLAACVADCGSFDLFESALQRLPAWLASGLVQGQRASKAALRQILRVVAAKPTAGWAIRRGQLVHGVEDPLEYLLALRDYSLKGRAQTISCPTFVCNAEGDEIGASAPRLVEALTAEKQYVRFTAAEGAGDHCEAGARMLYHATSFAWLDRILRPDT